MTVPVSLIEQIRRHAEQHPDAEGIAAPGRMSMSYSQLWSRITRLAAILKSMNVTEDRSIALALPDGPELIVMLLAAVAVSRCTILDPSSRSAELEFYLSDSNSQTLIVPSGIRSAAVAVAKTKGIRVVEMDPAKQGTAGMFDLRGWEADADTLPTYRNGRDVALGIYTSGTTSRPKCIWISHEMLYANAQNIQRALMLSPADRCLNIMPMFHAHGLVIASASTLFSGGCLICSSGFSTEQFFHWVEKTTPTWYTAAPAIHSAIVDEAERTNRKAAFRFIRSSASVLTQQTMRRMKKIFGAPVIEGYGMTECPLITSNPAGKQKPASVGLPSGPELKIVDGHGVPVQPGHTGEIMIRGSCVTSPPGEWLATGDAGYQDSDGYLFLTGRLKEIINRGGQKISPMEVDAVLEQHPAVAEAYDVRDLVGTLQGCYQKVQKLRSIGIDEIACLIDFGIDTDSVMAGLHHLNELRMTVNQPDRNP